jgi:hypothetical protein
MLICLITYKIKTHRFALAGPARPVEDDFDRQ